MTFGDDRSFISLQVGSCIGIVLRFLFGMKNLFSGKIEMSEIVEQEKVVVQFEG
jgi:hypothetical protein